MPDPQMKTISATEASVMLGVSPYSTRWMLYQKFAHGIETPVETTNRMDWGLRFQPEILKEVARQHKLEVIPNGGDNYIRRGLLGCTRDATIICPDRGVGALEVKCVFDYKVWQTTWRGGFTIPRHHEIQLQTQMYVGSGDGLPQYEWGMIAVWVCGDMYYYERRPMYDLWELLCKEADLFFLDIFNQNEPKPFGHPIEIPLLYELFPTDKGLGPLDLSGEYDHIKTSEEVSMYKYLKDQERGGKAGAEPIRAKMLALAGKYHLVKLPCGVEYKVISTGKGKRIDVYVPDHPTAPPPPPNETEAII